MTYNDKANKLKLDMDTAICNYIAFCIKGDAMDVDYSFINQDIDDAINMLGGVPAHDETSSIEMKIEEFLSKWQKRYDEYMSDKFPSNPNPRMQVTFGNKYAKVVREGAVEAFISIASGDIFMAASWQAPAKHVRGNVYSDQAGMEAITGALPHVRYLR